MDLDAQIGREPAPPLHPSPADLHRGGGAAAGSRRRGGPTAGRRHGPARRHEAGHVAAARLVNLKRIRGLDRIEPVDGGTRIGALARICAIESSALVRERYPALWQASRSLGHPPDPEPGDDRGQSRAVVPGLGHGAAAHRARCPRRGRRARPEPVPCPIEDFHLRPGVSCLATGEIVTSVLLPDPSPGTGSAFRKLGKRGGGWDIALVGCLGRHRAGRGRRGRRRPDRAVVRGADPAARPGSRGTAARTPPVRGEPRRSGAPGRRGDTSHHRRARQRRLPRSLARVLTLRTLRDAVVPGPAGSAAPMIPVTLTVNGTRHDLEVEPNTTLLELLREAAASDGGQGGLRCRRMRDVPRPRRRRAGDLVPRAGRRRRGPGRRDDRGTGQGRRARRGAGRLRRARRDPVRLLHARDGAGGRGAAPAEPAA